MDILGWAVSDQLVPPHERSSDVRLGERQQQTPRERHGGRWRASLKRLVLVAVGVGLLYMVQEQVADVLSSADRLGEIRFGWFVVMAAAEMVSYACLWALIRQMLPGVPWFLAATSQLVSNSVSKFIPGGAAVGGATFYRMLSVSGVAPKQAAGAMAATSVLSNALLFSIPAIAGVLALFGAPIPESLVPAAVVGAVLFGLVMAMGVLALAFTRPLVMVGAAISNMVAFLGQIVSKSWAFDPETLVAERSRLVDVLGARWPRAIAAAAGNWAFDYLALVAALIAVGAEPRYSLVLLAFAAASVLGMVPLTPGGLGFVEVGLYSTLILAGVEASDAGLATVAYRSVSLLFPHLSGALAWPMFKARYPGSVLGLGQR